MRLLSLNIPVSCGRNFPLLEVALIGTPIQQQTRRSQVRTTIQNLGCPTAMFVALHCSLGNALIFRPRPKIALSPIRPLAAIPTLSPHLCSSPAIPTRVFCTPTADLSDSLSENAWTSFTQFCINARACQLYLIPNESMPRIFIQRKATRRCL
jgi:hypothetical protein